MTTRILALLALTTLTACASQPGMSMVQGRLPLGQGLWNSDLQAVTPQTPPRIGIAPPIRSQGEQWNSWNDREREVIDRWIGEAQVKGTVAKAIYLPSLLMSGTVVGPDDLATQIRRAAAGADVDAVLMIQTSSASDRGVNGWSILYPTIVGMWFAPGTTIKATGMAEAVLVDANGTGVIAFGEGFGTFVEDIPEFYADDLVTEREAVRAALDELGQKLMRFER